MCGSILNIFPMRNEYTSFGDVFYSSEDSILGLLGLDSFFMVE